jgi:hypothetical protein
MAGKNIYLYVGDGHEQETFSTKVVWNISLSPDAGVMPQLTVLRVQSHLGAAVVFILHGPVNSWVNTLTLHQLPISRKRSLPLLS